MSISLYVKNYWTGPISESFGIWWSALILGLFFNLMPYVEDVVEKFYYLSTAVGQSGAKQICYVDQNIPMHKTLIAERGPQNLYFFHSI